MSPTDMAELCASSVRMSSFPDSVKNHWLGTDWKLPGPAGNDIA
jgi:AMP deaminase